VKAEVSRIDLSDEMLGFLKNFRSTWRKQSNKINQQEDMLKKIMKRHESLASHFTVKGVQLTALKSLLTIIIRPAP